MKRLLMAFCLFVLPACAHCGAERVKPPTDPEWCDEAEKNMTTLECKNPQGELITKYVCHDPDGGLECECDDPADENCWSFTEVCIDVQSADIPLEAECLAKMTDCAQMDTDCNYTTE